VDFRVRCGASSVAGVDTGVASPRFEEKAFSSYDMLHFSIGIPRHANDKLQEDRSAKKNR